jgi:hypothetical protein
MKKTSSPSKVASKPKKKTVTVGVRAVVFSEKAVAAAFTEWDRRFRENPEEFLSQAESLLKQTPETYGEACAPYFLQILAEIAP